MGIYDRVMAHKRGYRTDTDWEDKFIIVYYHKIMLVAMYVHLFRVNGNWPRYLLARTLVCGIDKRNEDDWLPGFVNSRLECVY